MKIRFALILLTSISLISLYNFQAVCVESPPYPPSSVITGITFDPTIVRKATGSDNWPVTWGDDDKIYTAFGDGYGFVPKSDSKISLGTARVSGDPTNFSGENLAPVSGSHKASGILMVKGVLYLWSRKDGGKLWKSVDHGSSWQYTGVAMQQANGDFYSLAFAQFGKNYSNSRDGYVYVYASVDGRVNPNNGFDHIYLFRARKEELDVRSAYEFYAGLDSDDNPIWSSNIDQRVPIFTDPDRVADLRIVFNSGINRYILTTWWGDTGGIGIYDAPEPWGPWTTVFYTSHWDQGFTFEYGFPAKWISADGLTMYMVFSGTRENDAFCVRKTTLSVSADTTAHSPRTASTIIDIK